MKFIMFKKSFWWYAPDYFDRWRLFPRLFIMLYLYVFTNSYLWITSLSDPSNAQSSIFGVIVGVGAAWFGLYVGNKRTDHTPSLPPHKALKADRIKDYPHDDLPPPIRKRK